jgi:Peptidase M15
MQASQHEHHHGTPIPDYRTRSLRSCAFAVAIVSAAVAANTSDAFAYVDDNWAYAMISEKERGQAQASEEPARGTRRRSAAAATADPENDEFRPQRSAPLKRKNADRERTHRQVASLAREIAPTHLPPLSVVEWARPKAVPAPAQAKDAGPMVASLGREFVAPTPSTEPSLAGDRIKWLQLASVDCLAAPLRGVLAELASTFGPLTVRWTCRDKSLNARVGGAKHSYHLTGNAVDFNMTGNYRAILSFLKGNKLVGGLKHYGGGAFHIDTGPRRTW